MFHQLLFGEVGQAKKQVRNKRTLQATLVMGDVGGWYPQSEVARAFNLRLSGRYTILQQTCMSFVFWQPSFGWFQRDTKRNTTHFGGPIKEKETDQLDNSNSSFDPTHVSNRPPQFYGIHQRRTWGFTDGSLWFQGSVFGLCWLFFREDKGKPYLSNCFLGQTEGKKYFSIVAV